MNVPLDNLTHGLLGAAVGMLRRREGGPGKDTPLTQTDKAVPWATFIAAELPDLDIFFGSGPMDEYIYHRGLTHSVFIAPVVAGIATAIMKLIWREAKTSTLYLWSLASVLIAHLLNDWMTGWGTRLLLPFSEARLALDWIPIIDLLYTLPLLAAVLVAWRRPHLRAKSMVALFAYLMIYTVGYRGVSHTLADRAVRAAYPAAAQVRVSPDLFNPLAWTYVADLGDSFATGRVSPLKGPVGAAAVQRKTPEDRVVSAIRQAPELKPFFDQFAFPLITYLPGDSGYTATLADIRYGGRMGYRILLNSTLHVVDIQSLGW